MGVVEDAIDAAANFVGPYVQKSGSAAQADRADDASKVIAEALGHLESINKADLAADPNAPYDASLAGVVYGLLDLVTTLGILPHLSTGVAFSQRPKSVLTVPVTPAPSRDLSLISRVIDTFLPILKQNGSGVQPLLSQRVLPDVISALAELAFCPGADEGTHEQYSPLYFNVIKSVPTSRLLPILTTIIQQPLPSWWQPLLVKELATIPLRPQGVRHTIEFLSLSYLSKNSQVPQDASGSQSQIPIPLEAVTQASRLLVLPPEGTSQDEWLQELAPQLLALLDGEHGRELSRAAGQIIAGGILSKKSTGAPSTRGWTLFAEPLLQAINPKDPPMDGSQITNEADLGLSLKMLLVLAESYSGAGLMRRLIGPIVLPLWGLLNYAISRPSLDKKWTILPQRILVLYMSSACEPKRLDSIILNLFLDGNAAWRFAPGAYGGVAIRSRKDDKSSIPEVDSIFKKIEKLDMRIEKLVSLLVEAKVSDEVIGTIFLQTTKRWLSLDQSSKKILLEGDNDPLAALTDAKLSESILSKFKEQFARSPQHILELMSQLLQNFVTEHQTRAQKRNYAGLPSRASLHSIVSGPEGDATMEDTNNEDIASFSISIVNTLVSSQDFKQTPQTRTILASIIAPLVYIADPHPQLPIMQSLTNAAVTLLNTLQPAPSTSRNQTADPTSRHRETLKTALPELTSPDPPNRTWALTTLRSLIRDPFAFPILDIPSLTHMLISASLADPESYVHTAAIPVLVDLSGRAANPVTRILVDAFIDIDEQSLKLRRGKETEEKAMKLRNALDLRLRIGEVLSRYITEEDFWRGNSNAPQKYKSIKQIAESCLSLASRRGQRKDTLQARTQILGEEMKLQQEGEEAWGGSIPNLMDPEGENPQDQADRDALLKIVNGWEDTGAEEDVRIRTSALSVLSNVLEHRLVLASQVMVDAALQMIVLVLTMEKGEEKAILRRAGVLVVMGLLRGLDAAIESENEGSVSLSMKQQDEVQMVLGWVRSEDADNLVRDHAGSVIEGLETLRMKKLYRIRDEGLRLGPNIGLEGHLRGLDVKPEVSKGTAKPRKMVIEEIE